MLVQQSDACLKRAIGRLPSGSKCRVEPAPQQLSLGTRRRVTHHRGGGNKAVGPDRHRESAANFAMQQYYGNRTFAGAPLWNSLRS